MQKTNKTGQLICVHLGLAWAIIIGVGMFMFSNWLPPMSPALSPEEIKTALLSNPLLRIGMALGAFMAPFFVAYAAAISNQLKRIEGENHVWTWVQLGAAAVGSLAVQFPAFFWLAATYRPEISADVVAALSDISFFMLIGAAGGAVLQNLAIGLCILSDNRQAIYPRWLGYWNIWLALLLVPGVLLPFFKSGPFAWNGIFGFWLIVVAFFFWMMLNYVYTLKAINKQT